MTIRTTAPVVLENCVIRGRGTLIQATAGNAHVTVRGCSGYGEDPRVSGKTRGDFFTGVKVGSLTVEHNYMEGVANGVRVLGDDSFRGDGRLLIRYNQAKNLDGVPSDGRGGRSLSNLQFGQDNGNHFVIIARLQGLTGAEISWNEIVSEPFVSSIGDVIDIYSSSGTATSALEIHHNYIIGGYPATPGAAGYGAGGITLDGRATDVAATATAFVRVHHNQIVGHSNFAIGMAAGHDNETYENRAVSTGQLADGRWVMTTTGAGIYVMNCGCYNQPASVFFNNFAHDNVAGWRRPSAPGREDYYIPNCAGGASGAASKCVNNAKLPDPISADTEAAEESLWRLRLGDNSITPGPASLK